MNLKNAVNEWLNNKVEDNYTKKQIINELLEYGCQSGMVSELIYYSETHKFYKDHHSEINQLLLYTMDSTDLSLVELFGDKWLNDDRQNLLAWFAFEETARKIAIENDWC